MIIKKDIMGNNLIWFKSHLERYGVICEVSFTLYDVKPNDQIVNF